jgi:hypothetical protein
MGRAVILGEFPFRAVGRSPRITISPVRDLIAAVRRAANAAGAPAQPAPESRTSTEVEAWLAAQREAGPRLPG